MARKYKIGDEENEGGEVEGKGQNDGGLKLNNQGETTTKKKGGCC